MESVYRGGPVSRLDFLKGRVLSGTSVSAGTRLFSTSHWETDYVFGSPAVREGIRTNSFEAREAEFAKSSSENC